MLPSDTAAHPPAAGSLVRRDQLHDRLSATRAGRSGGGLRTRGQRQDRAPALVARGVRRAGGVGVGRARRGGRAALLAVGRRRARARGRRARMGRARQPLARVQGRRGGRAAAVGSRLARRPGRARDRRPPRAALPRGARPARVVPGAAAADGARRARDARGAAARAASGAPGGRRSPRCARADLQLQRGGDARAARDGRDHALGRGPGAPLRADRGLGRRRAAGGALARGHAEPERFVREFSGSERTVAGYLLAEVLERQPPEVRELLLRTSLLDRVSGPLADFVTGGSGSERDPAAPRGRERVRHAARRGPDVVPLPPPVRRPPPPRAAAHRPADHRLAAPGGRGVARGARRRHRGGPARTGGSGLAVSRPAGRRPLPRAHPRRPHRDGSRAARRLPARRARGERRAPGPARRRPRVRRPARRGWPRTLPSAGGWPRPSPTSAGPGSTCCARR